MAKFKPYVMMTRNGTKMPFFVLAEGFHCHFGILNKLTIPGITCLFYSDYVLEQKLPGGENPHFTLEGAPSLQSALPHLKELMLAHGASPRAIELVGAISPWTKKELDIMADKLAKAAKAPKAEKEPKTKPVGGGGKATEAKANKGNPEALAKAREAADGKRAEAAKQKLTVLVKSKDSGLRGGRLAKLAAVEAAKPKTLGDALGITGKDDKGADFTIDMGAIRGMEKREHIKLG